MGNHRWHSKKNRKFLTASKYCGSGLKKDLIVVVVVVVIVLVILVISLLSNFSLFDKYF